MNIRTPYLLFIGDASDPLSIKMAKSAADWSPEKCVGELAMPGCSVSTGLPRLSIEDAVERGAKSLVLGFANSGGTIDEKWLPTILHALNLGMDIVSGLHDKLEEFSPLKEAASRLQRQLINIRHPKEKFRTANGVKRTGKRLLTVGTDCSVGKMYTSLSLTKALRDNGVDATFRATGQCGILVSGSGIAIDCVVADFISGAAESLSPNAPASHWDIIEGQGSLSHPAFAGVSLGLLHGSQPDALVVCHALNRTHMRGLPHQAFPTLQDTIAMNEMQARLTNPSAKVIGVSLNSSSVSEEEALSVCAAISRETGLPCIDPMRHELTPILEALV
ncbi:DUF1611 domain-containing protein [Alteromonas sediminis]|uniref:DUF1611 domain-containing protein n=1 Tax=Alteromonas sediminis TaxID=2259342 RepID=A0A3N5Z8B2_9ALTE|nr:N-acetyltransferase DgcN [Alteromonas sediminis]RPJ67044.1 DUF1611 domain-containing protein [Alteromonas sediminis]